MFNQAQCNGDLSEIRGLFVVTLKLLLGPQGNRGLRTSVVDLIVRKRKSISFFKGPYSKHYWPEACDNSILRFR